MSNCYKINKWAVKLVNLFCLAACVLIWCGCNADEIGRMLAGKYGMKKILSKKILTLADVNLLN